MADPFWSPGGAGVDADTAAELVKLGMKPEQVEAKRAAFEAPIEVHPDNWDTVQVFRLVDVGWVGTMSGLVAVQPSMLEMTKAAETLGIPATPSLIYGVKLISQEYANVTNKRTHGGGNGPPPPQR
jgi:hypothetical protein